MNTQESVRALGLRAVAALAVLALLAGCAGKSEDHASFKTPEEAVGAFVEALKKDDIPRLHKLLGPGTESLLDSGDAVKDKADRAGFVAAYEAKHSLAAESDGTMTLVIGQNDWPFPVPLVKDGGKWRLDGGAGTQEVIYRRIGRNELGAIDVCRGFVAAQNEYASEGRDGDPAGIYALKLLSDPGMHNGLYWATAEGEPQSPAGSFVASAASEGYLAAEGRRTPYHGYYFRMLYAQGANAKGGARDYFKDGLMTEGFALVAWPAEYGVSGVQTFIVNQDGVVYQKDLGTDTDKAAAAIQKFDPDSSWSVVEPPAEPVAPAAG